MVLFNRNSETVEAVFEKGVEEMGEKLSELQCEEAIIKDKERFGRVRKSLMDSLREKHGRKIPNRALSRVNKRLQEHYFDF